MSSNVGYGDSPAPCIPLGIVAAPLNRYALRRRANMRPPAPAAISPTPVSAASAAPEPVTGNSAATWAGAELADFVGLAGFEDGTAGEVGTTTGALAVALALALAGTLGAGDDVGNQR